MVQSGSDTGTAWAQALYWLSGGSLLFLTVYRVLVSVTKPAPAPRPVPAADSAPARKQIGAA